MALNSSSSALSLLHAEITGVSHHIHLWLLLKKKIKTPDVLGEGSEFLGQKPTWTVVVLKADPSKSAGRGFTGNPGFLYVECPAM